MLILRFLKRVYSYVVYVSLCIFILLFGLHSFVSSFDNYLWFRNHFLLSVNVILKENIYNAFLFKFKHVSITFRQKREERIKKNQQENRLRYSTMNLNHRKYKTNDSKWWNKGISIVSSWKPFWIYIYFFLNLVHWE